MATYATYRHVELYRVGYGKKRVLKPPGGGSSISFGGDEPHPSKTTSPTATAPHDKSNGTVTNGNHTNGHPTTNGTCNGTISNGSVTPNGSCTTASSPSSAKSMDTQSRLFGASDNHSIRNGDTPVKSTSKPKVRDHMRSSIFGDDSGTPRNGTPNGTGTPASTPSGGDTSIKASPEPPKPASAPAAAAQPPQQKQRVPPGGFSTALW